MSELIQKISASLVKKFKEVANPDEKIHFCIEGVKGNALIGTNKKVYSITSGSFKGTLCYSYLYDNITDIKVIPPLHGDNITLSIIPQKYDNKELKQRLYFQPEQNNLLKEVLTKISGLSKTYTYIEPMKEISMHQSSNEFIVPMKNILGKMYEKNVKPSEKVVISISIGDNQGIVCTNERLLLFKINEDKACKVGIFPLEEINDIEYSIGLVTGYLQIITPKVKVIKKKLREQELINIDNIISFGKKNYGELIDDLSKRLEEIIKNARRKKDPYKDVKDISGTGEEEKKTIREGKKNSEPEVITPIKNIDDLEMEPDEEIIPSAIQKDLPSFDEIAQKLSEEILEEIKSDEQSFYYSRDIVKQISQEVVKHSFPELISTKLPDDITAYVMKYLSENKLKKVPSEDITLEEFDESDGFDDLEFSEMDFEDISLSLELDKPETKFSSDGGKGKIPAKPDRSRDIPAVRGKEKIPAKPDNTSDTPAVRGKEKNSAKPDNTSDTPAVKGKEKNSAKPDRSVDVSAGKEKEKFPAKPVSQVRVNKVETSPKIDREGTFKDKLSREENLAIEKNLKNFTSLKNISAALLLDSKYGAIISKSIVENADYDKSSRLASDIIKLVRSSRQARKGTFIPQWKTEYEQGIVYVEEINLNYLLMIVGTEKSNFATLKMFIEKHKEELKKELK